MFRKVLIANRGAIATRIIRTLRRMGVSPVAVYSDADAEAKHVAAADRAVRLGPPPAAESYLVVERILAAARESGAEAIHPGYGFLSESAGFAEACAAAGVVFIGPTPQQMRTFGLKHRAREMARASEVPLLPGTGLLAGVDEALAAAQRIGYPVMLKSTGGGGGIGMRRCDGPEELAAAFEAVGRLARASFADAGLFLEKLVVAARHVEVQIFGDGAGKVVALGERDCSLQRRNQKVVEETPAPGLAAGVRERMLAAAVRLGRAVQYRSAGTVEFLLDAATGGFSFLEVNTRIQVEHGITEAVTGVDLVEWMVRLAAGERLDLDAELAWTVAPARAAIEVRLYAEDPGRGFRPSAGVLSRVALPAGEGVRVESGIEAGAEVTPYYDPLLAKIITSGQDRAQAIDRMQAALAALVVDGVETNREYLARVLGEAAFRSGAVHTRLLDGIVHAPPALEVLDGGTQTTVQDFPGRLGHWDVGVPPSGPMDALSFRLGNRLVGNPAGAAGLECTLVGPTLRFAGDAVVALTGADLGATIDGAPVARLAPVAVRAGAVLRLGRVRGPGARAYLCVRGGIDVPAYLGSRATFTLGMFGGHAGRALRAGDVLRLGGGGATAGEVALAPSPDLEPPLAEAWELAVLHGPHGAPDFFTPDDIDQLFAATWKVHHNSSRTGVRLIGPKPAWARPDGGEAGLHPSNIHDTAYAVGAVDFTGDMPVILGPDGPSLGGFVCPVTVVTAELWKVGQLRAGDTVRFRAVTLEEARRMAQAQEAQVATLAARPDAGPSGRGQGRGRRHAPDPADAVLMRLPESAGAPEVTVRQDGDANLLVEYGPMTLELGLRFRVHALMEWLARRRLAGVIDLTPGIRSLQIHHDDIVLPRERLLDELARAESELPATGDIRVPSRIVHLPLSWDDPATHLAIEKYTQTVRPDAPWCPSNIEFIRRINGLDSVDEVRRIVFDASFLVLGLGDVYLGAPVATPIDPRHRLVTTKYNPARTWTPENAVGIGGAYLCVYGMEGPGGYQFVGRTCQMWNRFAEGTPWLLRFFDQLRFHPVSAAELLTFRERFLRGRVKLDIEETTFALADHRTFLRENQTSIAAFKRRQRAAFEAERQRWAQLPPAPAESEVEAAAGEDELAEGELAVRAEVTGSVWQVVVEPGQRVRAGDRLVVLETMKMESPVVAPADGVVARVAARPGALAQAGQLLVVLRGR